MTNKELQQVLQALPDDAVIQLAEDFGLSTDVRIVYHPTWVGEGGSIEIAVGAFALRGRLVWPVEKSHLAPTSALP